MALSPQQLQALFQGESSGNQGAFASATPDMDQGQRNQYINQYGVGGTGYGDFLKWYGGGRQMPGAGTTGGPTGANFAANPGPQMQTPQNPTGPSTKISNQGMVNPTGPGFQASMSPWQQQAGGMQQAIGAYAGNGQGAMGRQGYVDPNLGNMKPQASYNVPQNQNLMGQNIQGGASLMRQGGAQGYGQATGPLGQGNFKPQASYNVPQDQNQMGQAYGSFRNQIYGQQPNPNAIQDWSMGEDQLNSLYRNTPQPSWATQAPQSNRMGYSGGNPGYSEFNPQRRSSSQGYTINPMMYRGWNTGR
jgi:hypothetical protein